MLDTEVRGDSDGLRDTARWLRSAEESVHATGTQVRLARGESESEWVGSSGEAFRVTMDEVIRKVDELSLNAGGIAAVLDRYADELDSVKAMMQSARDLAREGGLVVVAAVIEPPGPAPVAPEQLPKHVDLTPGRLEAHHAAAVARSFHLQQVMAYRNAEKEVTNAAKQLDQSVQFLKNEARNWTLWADLFSGGAALGVASASKYNAQTKKYKDQAKTARDHAARARAQGNLEMARRYSALAQERYADGQKNIRARDGNYARKYSNRMPMWGQRALSSNLGVLARGSGQFARAARPVLSKVPVLGLGLTCAGICTNVQRGQGVAKSVVSGGGSFLAGAMVGGMIGGPVGFAAGAVVGLGVGYAMDAGLADAIVDGGEKVGRAIGDGAQKFGSAIGDLLR
jgi:uncharacterized protein YukE